MLITFNEQLQRKQRRLFDVGLRRLSAAMWKTYHEHKGQSPSRMCKALQRTHGKSRLQRYLQWNLDDAGRLHLWQPRETVARKRAEFGKRLLFTTRTALTTAEILELYNRDKVEVEKDFHYMKAPDLRVRLIRRTLRRSPSAPRGTQTVPDCAASAPQDATNHYL